MHRVSHPATTLTRRALLGLSACALATAGGAALAPRRLVAIGPGALRWVTYLGAEDLLVALEDIERKPMAGSSYRLALGQRLPGLTALPSIGPGGPGRLPDIEQLLAVRADLAVTVTLDGQQQLTLRQRADLATLPLSYGDTGVLREDAVVASLSALGQALGREARAQTLVAFWAQSLAELQRRVAGLPPQPAYLGGVSLAGGQAITSTQAGHAPLIWAGARNLADAAAPGGKRVQGSHLFVDREQLLAWDPPLLLVDGGGLRNVLADHAKDPAFFARLRAVRERQIYLTLPFNAYNTNVENALVNAWFVAKLLHPAALADVDMRRLQAQVMTAFLGADVSDLLAQQGFGCGRLDLASGQWKPL